jgi:hypothetical protein
VSMGACDRDEPQPEERRPALPAWGTLAPLSQSNFIVEKPGAKPPLAFLDRWPFKRGRRGDE